MMEEWVTSRVYVERTVQGRQVLDTAEGILIALRRFSPDAAFHELLSAAERHRLPLFTIASALVDLASREEQSAELPLPAQSVAEGEWGELLRETQTGA
jgi:hypothetical protein